MLRINELYACGNGKEILKGINLEINKGEIHALMGPNGSGKSTLARVIMGIPGYKIKGSIFFNGKNITRLSPEKRAKLGIALTFQFPPEIKGVKLEELLQKIKKKSIDFEIPNAEKLMKREVNVDFSGGEKKISELIQVLSLNPKFLICDEIDSGLDIKTTEEIGKILKKFSEENEVSLLIISHSGEILNYLTPSKVHVMIDGKIVCSSNDWKKVWKTVKEYGYKKCEECIVSSNRP